VQLIAQAEPKARLTRMFTRAVVKTKAARQPGKAQTIATATTSSQGIQGDQHFRNVIFLMKGTHALSDASPARLPGVSDRRYGPVISTDTPKFQKSAYCGHQDTWGLIYSADPQRWNMSVRPFTIEGWVRCPLQGGTKGLIAASADAGNNRGWALALVNNVVTFYASRDGTAFDLVLSGTTIAANTWTHVCVERSKSGRVRMYVNGVMVSWVNFPHRINKSTADLSLFTYNGAIGFIGWMDNVRITKGVARYASDAGFTPPIEGYPTTHEPINHASDPYWDLVTCLITAEQDPVVDLKRGAAVSIGRGLDWNEANGGNHTLAGTGSVAHVDGQWDIGGRDEPFTLEFDAGFNSTTNGGPVFMEVANSWRFWQSRGETQFNYWNGTGWVNPFPGWAAGLWSHNLATVCLTRDEYGVWRLYARGRLITRLTKIPVPPAPTTHLSLSPINSATMDNLRMTWGVARYTSDEPLMQDPTHALPYPLSGPPYVPPVFPPPNYPISLDFPDENEGFDSGDPQPREQVRLPGPVERRQGRLLPLFRGQRAACLELHGPAYPAGMLG
jgi:hypothetical protein